MKSEKSAAENTVRKSSESLKRPPGVSQLYYAKIMNAPPITPLLDVCAVPESGAVVRVPAFEGMFRGQSITLYWEAKETYSTSAVVAFVGRFVDMVVPRAVVQKSHIPADNNSPVRVYYEVRLLNGTIERSPITLVYISADLTPNPAVIVPDVPSGDLDPHSIAAPGLKIVFPPVTYLIAAGCGTFGRDGQLITYGRYALRADEEFIHIPSVVLEQTEPEGDVWINYTGVGEDNIIIESLFTVLRVIA